MAPGQAGKARDVRRPWLKSQSCSFARRYFFEASDERWHQNSSQPTAEAMRIELCAGLSRIWLTRHVFTSDVRA